MLKTDSLSYEKNDRLFCKQNYSQIGVKMEESRPIRVLCILSNLLGIKVISKCFRETLEQIENVECEFLFIDIEDYQLECPKYLKWSNSLESVYVIEKKLKEKLKNNEYDTIFINGLEILAAAHRIAPNNKFIVAMDTTPFLVQRMTRKSNPGIKGVVKQLAGMILTRGLYSKAMRSVSHFLPLSEWCATSLQNDFDVNRENISSAYFPLNYTQWNPGSIKRKDENFVLLFVGNDFQRKGGPFLLDLLENHLPTNFRLKIISNDPYVQKDWGERVQVISGLGHDQLPQLIRHYQLADAFVFPTKHDQLGLVVAEAMAVGLPVFATNVGGIVDLVDTTTGHLFTLDSPPKLWAQNLIQLSCDQKLQQTMGENSRKKIKELCNQERFNLAVRKALSSLN